MISSTLICLSLVIYAYFGYPFILFLFQKKEDKKDIIKGDYEPTVSIIITAKNEEEVIEDKIKNTLDLTYFSASIKESKKVEIIVASDASSDNTDNIVKNFKSEIVKLIRSEEGEGKEFTQKKAILEAKGELIFFTDAKTKLEKDSLTNAINYFKDPAIGAVSSIDKIILDEEGQSGEGFYIKYEMFLRRLESNFCSLIGLSGSGFLIRKEICKDLKTNLPSDFSLLLQARLLGFKAVLAEDVVCSYKAVKTEAQEFNRKVRTVLRGITTFFISIKELDFKKDPKFAFQLISHKLFRWLVPFFLIIAFVTTILGAASSILLKLLLLSYFIFLFLALTAFFEKELKKKPIFKIPLFFTLTNIAILKAWTNYLSGKRTQTWTPSTR